MTSQSANFGIYVHWPYCAAKCPYCDFNSHVRSELDEGRWACAIASELAAVAALQGKARPDVSSIFFGGGTPSLMSGRAVAHVLDAIAKQWNVARDVEVTLESNPASAEAARFRDYLAAGVNRLSLGVQSFDDAALKFLGRLHDAQEAREAARLAIAVFPRVSLDLIYARPDQSVRAWEGELSEALSFGTEHLSLYQLTIEAGTPFAVRHAQGALVVPGDDAAVALYEATQALCDAARLPAYEVSNHARPGAECRHNLIYWRYGDYAGAGPGAHGRLTRNGARVATQGERNPERWLARVEAEGHAFDITQIDGNAASREQLLMGLRLSEGIDPTALARRWGETIDMGRVAFLEREGLIARDAARLTATPKGRLVLNAVIAALAV